MTMLPSPLAFQGQKRTITAPKETSVKENQKLVREVSQALMNINTREPGRVDRKEYVNNFSQTGMLKLNPYFPADDKVELAVSIADKDNSREEALYISMKNKATGDRLEVELSREDVDNLDLKNDPLDAFPDDQVRWPDKTRFNKLYEVLLRDFQDFIGGIPMMRALKLSDDDQNGFGLF